MFSRCIHSAISARKQKGNSTPDARYHIPRGIAKKEKEKETTSSVSFNGLKDCDIILTFHRKKDSINEAASPAHTWASDPL